MADKSNRKITFPQSDGFFQGLLLRIKLILRLIGDPRVNTLAKLLPIGSVIYLVLPFDIPTRCSSGASECIECNPQGDG
jgi:hypothetical protein